MLEYQPQIGMSIKKWTHNVTIVLHSSGFDCWLLQMVPVTSEFWIFHMVAWGAVWQDDIRTEDSPHDCMGTCLAGISPSSYFRTQERMYVFTFSDHYCYTILSKIGMCRQILVSPPNIKFNENLFCGFSVVTCRQTGQCKRCIFATFSCKHA
jgi:hypothetical protein